MGSWDERLREAEERIRKAEEQRERLSSERTAEAAEKSRQVDLEREKRRARLKELIAEFKIGDIAAEVLEVWRFGKITDPDRRITSDEVSIGVVDLAVKTIHHEGRYVTRWGQTGIEIGTEWYPAEDVVIRRLSQFSVTFRLKGAQLPYRRRQRYPVYALEDSIEVSDIVEGVWGRTVNFPVASASAGTIQDAAIEITQHRIRENLLPYQIHQAMGI